MTANIRVRASAPALRVAKASPAFRLAVASADTVESVIAAIAALNDPQTFSERVEFLARNYAASATRLDKILIPVAISKERRLVATVLKFGITDNIRTLRVACDLKAVRAINNRTLPTFDFASLVAVAEGNGKRAKNARVAVHALGFAWSARGVIAIEETTADCPGVWPAAPAERIALAFNLVVRIAHGARFDSIHLVRS